jgi:dTDP-4-amino-4,6-dideoxygalactose transaminase
MSISTVQKKIPYVDVAGQHAGLKAELHEAFERTLKHGHFILGEEVEEFERHFARLCQTPFAIGLNSGTDALILSLRALDIGPGDEVITAPNSFVASASCVAMVGARPVFVDVREDYNLNPALLEKAITPRTKAIIPVHLTGSPADMDRILEIARRHRLRVVEDAAQAVTAEYKGRRVGSFGDTGCFSLHPLKTLNACGDGGVVVTHSRELYEKIQLMRNLGLRTRENAVLWSSNSRLDTLQASLLLVKLKYLAQWTEKRRANARFYQRKLKGLAGVQVPVDVPHQRAVYHTFIIQADRRDKLKQYLADQEIGTAIHYAVPIHLQETARDLGYHKGDFPVAERQAARILSLPVYPELRREDLERVVETIRTFYRS